MNEGVEKPTPATPTMTSEPTSKRKDHNSDQPVTKRQILDEMLHQIQAKRRKPSARYRGYFHEEQQGQVQGGQEEIIWRQGRWPRQQQTEEVYDEISVTDLKLLEKFRWDPVLQYYEDRNISPRMTNFSVKFPFTPTVPRRHPLWSLGNRQLLNAVPITKDVLSYCRSDVIHDHRKLDGQKGFLTLRGKAFHLRDLLSKLGETNPDERSTSDEIAFKGMASTIEVPYQYLMMMPYLLTVTSTDQDSVCRHIHLPCSVCLHCLKRVICHYRNCMVCNKALQILMVDTVGWIKIGLTVIWDVMDVKDLLYHQLVFLQEGPAGEGAKYPIFRENREIGQDGMMGIYEPNCWPHSNRDPDEDDGANLYYNVQRPCKNLGSPGQKVWVKALKYPPVYFLSSESHYSAVVHAREGSTGGPVPALVAETRDAWVMPYSKKVSSESEVPFDETEADFIEASRPTGDISATKSSGPPSVKRAFDEVIRQTLDDHKLISGGERDKFAPDIKKSCSRARKEYEDSFSKNDSYRTWTRLFYNLYCRQPNKTLDAKARRNRRARKHKSKRSTSTDGMEIPNKCSFFERRFREDCCDCTGVQTSN